MESDARKRNVAPCRSTGRLTGGTTRRAILLAALLATSAASAAPVSLPQFVAGPAGATWSVQNTGGTSGGAFGGSCSGSPGLGVVDASAFSAGDAFDWAYQVVVDGNFFVAPGTVDLTGSTLTAGPVALSGLDVTYSFHASTVVYGARVLARFHNPSGSTINATVQVPVNFGSDGGTTVRATSSGDLVVTLADRWVVTSDSGPYDPVNTTALWGTNASLTPSAITQTVFNCAGTEGLGVTFNLSVPAGQTRALMFFAGLGNVTSNANTIAGAIASAPLFDSLASVPADLIADLTPADIAQVVNWTRCGNGVIDSGEQCDDGNGASGDCCSSTCQYEANGDPCTDDGFGCTSDLCDGAGTCLHAVLGAGETCRADAGACDVAETCDGVDPNCPLDAFEPASTPCPDDGEPCTLDECDGAGACLHPAGNAGLPCRAAAGVCDVEEQCDGIATSCPADGKATTLCRAAVGTCDLAESCDGIADDCPADAVEAFGTICRADAGDCDVAEVCDGSSGLCPADASEADGTPCNDGSVCTQTDACSSGACVGSDPLDCDDGNACTADTCDATAGCENTAGVLGGCRTAQKSLLLLKQKGGTKDKLVWKWTKGQATALGDLADPTASASYALCIYAGTANALIADAAIPSGSGWSTAGSKGYRFSSLTGTPDGVQKTILKSGANGKAKALVKGKGANLPDPALGNLPLPVTAQLVNGQTGVCLEGVFEAGDVLKNDSAQFKAKAQ